MSDISLLPQHTHVVIRDHCHGADTVRGRRSAASLIPAQGRRLLFGAGSDRDRRALSHGKSPAARPAGAIRAANSRAGRLNLVNLNDVFISA